eukprot:gene7125-230_t
MRYQVQVLNIDDNTLPALGDGASPDLRWATVGHGGRWAWHDNLSLLRCLPNRNHRFFDGGTARHRVQNTLGIPLLGIRPGSVPPRARTRARVPPAYARSCTHSLLPTHLLELGVPSQANFDNWKIPRARRCSGRTRAQPAPDVPRCCPWAEPQFGMLEASELSDTNLSHKGSSSWGRVGSFKDEFGMKLEFGTKLE